MTREFKHTMIKIGGVIHTWRRRTFRNNGGALKCWLFLQWSIRLALLQRSARLALALGSTSIREEEAFRPGGVGGYVDEERRNFAWESNSFLLGLGKGSIQTNL